MNGNMKAIEGMFGAGTTAQWAWDDIVEANASMGVDQRNISGHRQNMLDTMRECGLPTRGAVKAFNAKVRAVKDRLGRPVIWRVWYREAGCTPFVHRDDALALCAHLRASGVKHRLTSKLVHG